MTVIPVVLSTMTGEITATDWTYRHSVWISQYLHGDFSPILKYPPLFHFLMMPFMVIGLPMQIFQIVFIILATVGILYMANRLENENTVIYLSILLATSIAFVEFASALMPQALDYLFFSLAVLFYYQNRVKLMVIPLAIITLMHVMGGFFVLILFAHSFITKKFDMTAILFMLGLIMIPLIFFYSFGNPVPTPYEWDVEAQMLWESQYTSNPIIFFGMSGFMAWVMLPYAIYKLYGKKFKLTDSQLLYVIWILAFLGLGILEKGIWRMISYQIVPLSLLVASLVSKNDR